MAVSQEHHKGDVRPWLIARMGSGWGDVKMGMWGTRGQGEGMAQSLGCWGQGEAAQCGR